MSNDSQHYDLHLVKCSACQASGFVNGLPCQRCRGLGQALATDKTYYYFLLPITRGTIFLRQAKRRAFLVLDTMLMAAAASGFFAWLWWLSMIGDFWDYQNWLNARHPLLVWVWLAAALGLFVVYRFCRRQQEQQKIPAKDYLPGATWSADSDWPASVKNLRLVNMADYLSEDLLSSIEKSYVWCGDLGQGQVDILHYFYLLLGESKDLQFWLSRLNLSGQTMVESIANQLAQLPKGQGQVVFSNALSSTILKGFGRALAFGRSQLLPMDTLLVAREFSPVLSEILYDLKVDDDKLNNLVAWSDIELQFKNNRRAFQRAARLKPGTNMDRAYTALATPLLDSFGLDLTVAAKYNRLPMFVARQAELSSLLSAMDGGQSGSLLVGQPGVGKHSLVYGLAELMVMEKVPAVFQDKRLVEVDVARLIGGVSPAQAQERLLAVINEIVAARNCIVYWPDIENLLGLSSGSEASLDLSEILADAINKGLIYCLASTTSESYTHFLEGKPLARAMTKIDVEEPEEARAIQILESKVPNIEGKYQVYCTYEAIAAAVAMSKRYNHQEFLPDKAIRLLSQAAAEVAGHRQGKQAPVLDDNAVAEFISAQLKVPATQVNQAEGQKLLELESKIHERMIGQEEAVSMVAESLRRARVELRDTKRPIAGFLFLGPTGVGKTELAKTLAEVYFGTENAMVRLDMSEYQAGDAVEKMIGNPEGVKGYLTEKIRQLPFALILLDEIEKANPRVLDLFLQVIDDGRLTDGQGRTIDFSNTIIIATSNIGAEAIKTAVEQGRDLSAMKQQIIDEYLIGALRPEFVNRFDGIVLFKPLALAEVTQIAKLLVAKLGKMLAAKGIILELSDRGAEVLAQGGYQPEFGARPLRRLLQEKIENVIAKKILAGEVSRRDKVVINDFAEIEVIKARQL